MSEVNQQIQSTVPDQQVHQSRHRLGQPCCFKRKVNHAAIGLETIVTSIESFGTDRPKSRKEEHLNRHVTFRCRNPEKEMTGVEDFRTDLVSWTKGGSPLSFEDFQSGNG